MLGVLGFSRMFNEFYQRIAGADENGRTRRREEEEHQQLPSLVPQFPRTKKRANSPALGSLSKKTNGSKKVRSVNQGREKINIFHKHMSLR